MDEQLDAYFNSLIDDCLTAPAFSGLNDQDREGLRNQIGELFNNTMLNLLIDQLNDSQLSRLEAVDPESPDMETTIIELASEVPDFAAMIETRLNELVEQIKTTGQLPQEQPAQ